MILKKNKKKQNKNKNMALSESISRHVTAHKIKITISGIFYHNEELVFFFLNAII